MTYKEAEKYRDKHMDLVNTHSILESFDFKIKYILIAPKNKEYTDRMNVLSEAMTEKGNEVPLSSLGFLNETLDVYIIGGSAERRYEYLLYDYLSETDQ